MDTHHGYDDKEFKAYCDSAKMATGSLYGMVAWKAWQASRESLVINLPVMPKAQRSDEEATFSAGGCDMLSKCIKSIEAAGFKVTQ